MPSLQDVANAVLQALQAWFNPFAWLQSAVRQLGPDLFDRLAMFLTATRGPLSGEGLTAALPVRRKLALFFGHFWIKWLILNHLLALFPLKIAPFYAFLVLGGRRLAR